MATNYQVADTALSEEAFFTLFLMVEENECLWRIDHEGYKNVHNKDRLWKEICRRLQERFPNLNALKPDEIKRQFNNKRRQYQDEKKKKTFVKSGQAAPTYVGKWKFFSALSFLEHKCPPPPQGHVLGVQEELREEDLVYSPVDEEAPVDSPSEPDNLEDDPQPDTQQQPEPQLRKKKKPKKGSDDSCEGRLAALNNIAAALTVPTEEDECAIFGRLIASRLRHQPAERQSWFQVLMLDYATTLENTEMPPK